MKPQNWAAICHLSGLANLGSIIIVTVVLLFIGEDDRPVVAKHGKEAINFNISYFIYASLIMAVAMLTTMSSRMIVGFEYIVGLFLLLGLFHFLCIFRAAIKANHGEDYRYPLCLRFLK